MQPASHASQQQVDDSLSAACHRKHSNVANCRDGGGMTQDTTGLVMMAEFFSTRSGFFDFMEDQIVAVSIGVKCRR